MPEPAVVTVTKRAKHPLTIPPNSRVILLMPMPMPILMPILMLMLLICHH